MSFPIWFFISALFLVFPASAQVQTMDIWPALKNQSLEVVEGSALDFSNLRSNKPAGAKGWVQTDQNGHLRFAGDTQPQRFLCASMVPSEPNGGLPGKLETDRWVNQLERTGYNLVRLHFIDAILMTNRVRDFDYDPIAMDRLQYLMSRLKAAGIYWIVDGLTSDNGAFGNILPHRWDEQREMKGRLFYDPEAVEHWKRLITSIWGLTNPYTGIAPINDPAMLGIILVNEQSLAAYFERRKGALPDELLNQFGVWQATGERGVEGVSEQLRRKEKKGGGLESNAVIVPKELWSQDRLTRDFLAFVAAKETSLFLDLDDFVRKLGFKGLTSSYNYRPLYLSDLARSKAGWIDMHAYQSIPTNFAMPGSMLVQSSIFDDVGQYGRELANTRQWGKPFTVTEYSQPFWNMWRHESAAWIPALAAYQDWDAICQFAELPVLLAHAEYGAPRRRAIYPYAVGGDPITRAGERLAALLFFRGDVSPSRIRVRLGLNPERVLTDGNAWGRVPKNLSRLSLVAGSGLDISVRQGSLESGRDIYFSLATRPDGFIEKAGNKALKQGVLLGKDPVGHLKSSGLLQRSNRTEMSRGLFETDTGQILFDASKKRLSIVTERTVAFTQRSGSASGGGVELAALSSPATVAVGALDDNVISQSHRLLIWVLTDALNTGMEFSDPARTTLKTLGRFPPRIRAVTGQLAIKHGEAGTLKVWAIDQTGRRVAEVPARTTGGFLRFAIDNVIPGVGPVTYFEVADH